MKPRIKLAESRVPDGSVLELFEHDGTFSISLAGKELMHSNITASERLLGSLGVAQLTVSRAGRVLIGGLGLGFTLRSVLESVGPDTRVEVVELIPQVIDWNHSHLKDLNGGLLLDPRVETRVADVNRIILEAKPDTYDAILLDVDNGPVAMVQDSNASLYSESGLRSMCQALVPGGRIALWSAALDKGFENRLKQAGLKHEARRAKRHENAKQFSHVIYLADRPMA